MGLKTYLLNRMDSRKFRLNGIRPSTRLPNKQKLCLAFRDHLVYSANELPHKVDFRNDMTPVEDQSKIGSCAANCLAGAYEYLTKKSNGRNTDVSRLFIYYNGRAKEGKSRVLTDSGCTMTDAIEALEEYGTCLESIWPYEISQVNSRPNDRAFQEAKNHKITEALQIEIDLYEMKSCLAQGFPFAFGLRLFKSFDKASSISGVVPMPDASERVRSSHGSHALLAVGYSDQSESFIVRNSWGEDWGEKGYCYIPYCYMTNPELCFDVWAVRKLANDNFGNEHWDMDDSINYLKAAVAFMALGSNNNYNDDNSAIEEIAEEDEPNKSGSNHFSAGQSYQWPNHSGCEAYTNNGVGGSGGPWYQQPDAGNIYSGNGASSYYGQQQQYSGGGNNYNQQQPWGGAGYDQYGANFQPNNNFPGHFQNQYQDNFQGANSNYQSQPNNYQFPVYGTGQNYQNTASNPSLADIMNSESNGNQQYGMGYDYSNTQYNYPNQYGQ